MADFHSIGAQCSQEDCKQLDFLPVTCKYCSLLFCKVHSFIESHQCTKCPADVNLPEEKLIKTKDSFKCSFKSCVNKELTRILCEHCQAQVCLQHRHQRDHDCPKIVPVERIMAKTKEHVDKILESSTTSESPVKRLRNAKAQKTAAKVQLMKMKMKSEGMTSLPQEERCYFRVILPLRTKSGILNAFVSREWTMGKVIDDISDRAKVVNNNHKSDMEVLRLFRFQDGQSVSSKLDEQLKHYMENEDLFNGDSLVLEYVADKEVSSIDPKLYQT